MKFSEFIYEMPVKYPEPKQTVNNNGSISIDAINRLYDQLGFRTLNVIGEIVIFMAKNKSHVIGVRSDELSSGSDRVDQIFRLVFKDEPTFTGAQKFVNPKHVKWVRVNTDYQVSGISTEIYGAVASCNYSIISDITQYEPGVKLWESLAKKYGVLIVDVTRGVLSNDGKPIIYDGKNIPSEEIWSTVPDRSKEDIVLVLTPERIN